MPKKINFNFLIIESLLTFENVAIYSFWVTKTKNIRDIIVHVLCFPHNSYSMELQHSDAVHLHSWQHLLNQNNSQKVHAQLHTREMKVLWIFLVFPVCLWSVTALFIKCLFIKCHGAKRSYSRNLKPNKIFAVPLFMMADIISNCIHLQVNWKCLRYFN